MNIGDVYKLKADDGNPFSNLMTFAEIKDIKDGWVLYRLFNHQTPKDTVFFQNESKKINDFLSIYAPVA